MLVTLQARRGVSVICRHYIPNLGGIGHEPC